jgi:hypothetical protein
LYQFTNLVMELAVIINSGYNCYEIHKTLSDILLSKLVSLIEMKLLGIISVVFDETDQLQIRFSAFVKYLRKMGVR